MGVLILISKLIYQKSDVYTNISLALIITLINNPYCIWDIGLELSYLATLGIIFFYPILISKLIEKNKKFKFIKESIAISISVQIFILPILIITFHKFSINFIISNILATPIFSAAIFLGAATIILGGVLDNVGSFLSIFLNIDLLALNWISEVLGKNEFGNILIGRPNFLIIILYYFLIFLFKFIYNVTQRKLAWHELTLIQKKEFKFLKLLEQKKNLIIKFLSIILIIFFIIKLFIAVMPGNLKINFIDVGQGDSMLIQTSYHKNILIDGGGSLDKEKFDVGEKTLIPYLLNKNINKIDFVMISHFDTDHVGGLLTVMEKLKVDTAIISKQGETSENYEKFKNIVKEKHIKVLIVGQGDTLKIEKNLYFDILWPNKEKYISENILNNNSIVAKLKYKNFSMLLTGDIEKIAEKQMLTEYKDSNILNATVLKVAHHGSKTSSTQVFLEVVKPKIALIGVGKNNLFGHPNGDIIERVEKIGAKVYRTDEMGEISIVVDGKGKIKIRKLIEKREENKINIK